MKKFKWRTSMDNTESEDSEYAQTSGEFEMSDDATESEIASMAQKLAMENISIEHFAIHRRPDHIDWSKPLEVIHDMDGEIERGVCRLIGPAQGEGKYVHIIGISWNPPRETIYFATELGEIKGEKSNSWIQNK